MTLQSMGNHRAHINYRPDIDGLRAIAVLSVVACHLGIWGFSGGFVGVDVFFVISGYLISKIIYAETSNGSFSISGFYMRRARRILPALFVIMLVSSIFAWGLLYPSELVSYAETVVATALFGTNIYLYEVLDYFSNASVNTPLLHLWSLGVEEQFYIVFPITAILFSKLSSRVLLIAIILSIFVSAGLSQWVILHNQSAGFYLLPYRCFELLIGSLIALPSLRNTFGKSVSVILFLIGISMIVAAVVTFGSSTPFPGFAALLPCVGAALIIFSGETRNMVSDKLLGNDLAVFIGKISYSLYLVHWPVIVFGKRAFPYVNEQSFVMYAFAASLMLAWLSYRFIEQPFRKVTKVKNRAIVSSAIAFSTIFMIVASVTINKNGFVKETTNERVSTALSYLEYDTSELYMVKTCFQTADQNPTEVDISKCLPAEGGKKAILWGDSHAAQFIPGMKKTFSARGYSLGFLTAQSCPPIMGVTVASNPQCGKFNETVLPIILSQKPDVIVMSANWVANDVTMDLLELTIKQLSTTGIKLVILGEAPLYKQNVPVILADRIKSGSQDFSATEELEHGFLDNSNSVMRGRFANRNDVTYISVLDAMCPDYKCPLTTPDGSPTAFDIAHFTRQGSEMFAGVLTPRILQGL